MGLGVRHWLRTLRVEAEASGQALVTAGVCNLCGLPMRVKAETGGSSMTAVDSMVTLRCDRCDITSVERREDAGRAIGAHGGVS
jgi:hypothetical protein